ncbi:PREDICTED: vesicular glutamate transporter 3-like [Priapulus caudatus]|uniref:Vesicular glutamate transporter 3-like n=1 Tax=Priapulus caudatus TaxID=37621 RepID=A0ABM1E727_PRICU|nr:PREDICTED: vesicular glutamate transporter 3-like [Priapulus caudatus]
MEILQVDYKLKWSDLRMGPFTWDKSSTGLVLSSFFWGYMLTQIPGGYISRAVGGTRVFGYAMLMCTILTALTPVLAHAHYGLLVLARILEGACQGVVFPAQHHIWSEWAPPLERSMLVAYSYAGNQAGNILALPMSGLLCDWLGWESIFFFFGIIGLIWFIFWIIFAYDTPACHPRISEREKNYIERSHCGQLEQSGV